MTKKINLKQDVLDHKGKSVGRTFGDLLSEILISPAPDDAPQNKHRYFRLVIKIGEKEEIEIDQEESNFILEKVRRIAGPLFVGRCEEAFASGISKKD